MAPGGTPSTFLPRVLVTASVDHRPGTLTVSHVYTPDVQRNRLVFGLAVAFGGMAGLLVLVALFEPFALLVAVPMAAVTYLFWYHATGRLRRRVRKSAEPSYRREPGGFGTDARGEWAPSHERYGDGGRTTRNNGSNGETPDIDRSEAYRRLGLRSNASTEEIKRAYRQKVKEVHPDRGGDEERFKQITEAYETLIE